MHTVGLGLTRHGWNVAPSKRGKNVRSIVAQPPAVRVRKDIRHSYVIYSMNKKKRWLLPERFKEEIELEKENCNSNKVRFSIKKVDFTSLFPTFRRLRRDSMYVYHHTLAFEPGFSLSYRSALNFECIPGEYQWRFN